MHLSFHKVSDLVIVFPIVHAVLLHPPASCHPCLFSPFVAIKLQAVRIPTQMSISAYTRA